MLCTIQLFVFLYNCIVYGYSMNEDTFLRLFAKRLVKMRHDRALSQEELAERAGLHAVAITYIETGKRVPKLDTVYKLAHGLGVSVSELLTIK